MTSPDIRTPFVENEEPHPWRRLVSLGDSFTEGIGDPEPGSPGGHRGWADRVAEVLGSQVDDFAYANLAVRGKLIRQISDDQIDAALALKPDLVTLCAGGNDVIRPRTDPDEIAELFDSCVSRLSASGAAVARACGVRPGAGRGAGVIRTRFDGGWIPGLRASRGTGASESGAAGVIAAGFDAGCAALCATKRGQDPPFSAEDPAIVADL